MSKIFIEGPIVLATHNEDKIRSFREALKGLPIEILTAKSLDIESPEETESTISGNAILKARWVSERSGLAAIADDSGFCISAIGDLPGPNALEWAGPHRNFDLAVARVGEHLERVGAWDGPARFVSCVAVALPDGTADFEEAETVGRLIWPPRGDNEGYRSIFALPGETASVAEAGKSEIYRHRNIAVQMLIGRMHFSTA
jgi:XTP/dITP diphosphohydrolase